MSEPFDALRNSLMVNSNQKILNHPCNEKYARTASQGASRHDNLTNTPSDVIQTSFFVFELPTAQCDRIVGLWLRIVDEQPLPTLHIRLQLKPSL
jgi:hypothetical protein